LAKLATMTTRIGDTPVLKNLDLAHFHHPLLPPLLFLPKRPK